MGSFNLLSPTNNGTVSELIYLDPEKIGSAAMGAMSENPELSGKALPFVGLAEGICLWGMLVAVLILIL